jgi:antitoxin PrlF
LAGITFVVSITEAPLTTTVTVKGQVTLLKKVRDAAGIQPGDRVEVRAAASGAVIIEKPRAADDYQARVYGLARRKLIRGITTDELLKMTRGDPALDPQPKRSRPKKK